MWQTENSIEAFCWLASATVPSWHGHVTLKVTSGSSASWRRSFSTTTTSTGSLGSTATGSRMTRARPFVTTKFDTYRVTRCFHLPASAVRLAIYFHTYFLTIDCLCLPMCVVRWIPPIVLGYNWDDTAIMS